MSARRVRVLVFGMVQGVSFRWSAEREARSLGLTGWVRNRADGSVETVAEGAEAPLRAFVAWCRRGPPGAAVDRLEDHWSDGEAEFSRFEIRH